MHEEDNNPNSLPQLNDAREITDFSLQPVILFYVPFHIRLGSHFIIHV